MNTVAPCKDCMSRKLGCHGKCNLYSSWKAEYLTQVEAFKQKQQRSREAENNTRRVWA